MNAYRYTIEYFDEGIQSFEVRLHKFQIIKETPCGFYIWKYGKKKWVPCIGVKQSFCHKKEIDALVALQKRREKYMQILRHNIKANALHLEAIIDILNEHHE